MRPCLMLRYGLRPTTLWVIAALVVAHLFGCAADKGSLASPTLSDPSKADDGGQEIPPIGPLTFGGEVTGDFVRDDQFDGYTFSAEAGAVVTLDNSHRGSAAALDSTLFLYGPRNEDGFYGAEALAFDDDSGWGLHARIRDFVVPEGGEYLAVLSTYAGLDRGHYRLTLTCESERCQPSAAPTVEISGADELSLSEGGADHFFQVRLTAQPTEAVQVWVESNDVDEAVVYPTRIFFCPAGMFQNNTGCASDRGDPTLADPDHGLRVVEVRVSGVADGLDDGDAAFDINFRVESLDPSYAGLALPPLRGTNADVRTTTDYAELDSLTDDALLEALSVRLAGHEVFGYQGVNSARTLLFGTVDVHDGQVESLYDGTRIDAPGESILAYMRGFNTEHSWPQGQFDRLDPMVSDLHHIFPTDRDSNSLRSNYGFGENALTPESSSGLGPSTSDGREEVFQVRPERRGDVARAHFYMVARYGFDKTIEIVFDDDGIAANGRMEDDEEAVLRLWHTEDPVDEWERRRNERVAALQGNRNPFIDRPDLVDRISDF